jgi:hypothetical protein
MSPRRLGVVLALVLSAAAAASDPHVAYADEPASSGNNNNNNNDDDDRIARARDLFVRGAALVRDSRWADALPLLEQSSRLRAHATTTYNLGYCERVLEHLTRAQMHFRRALSENKERGGTELGPELVVAAKDYLVEIDARVARPLVTIAAEGSDIALAVDGRPLELQRPSDERDGAGGRPRTPRLVANTREPGAPEVPYTKHFELVTDPGRHTILVHAAGSGLMRTLEIDLAPGSAREIIIEAPAPAPRMSPPLDVRGPETAPPDPTRRTWSLIVGGAGIVSLGIGAVLAAKASSSWSTAQDACPIRSACPDDRGADLSANARFEGNLATAALVTGASAVAGAVILWLAAPSRSSSSSSSSSPSSPRSSHAPARAAALSSVAEVVLRGF